MQCKQCGHELSENAKFCMNCGAKVEIEEVTTDVKQPVVEPVVEEPVVEPVIEEPVVEETVEEVVEDTTLDETVVVRPVQENITEDTGVKEWYYVEDNVSKGPCTEKEIKDMIAAGTLTAFSFIWKEGMANWSLISDSVFAEQTKASEPKVENMPPEPVKKVEEQKIEEKEWYYITGQNNQEGPVEESVMRNLIERGMINGNTYVWKDGMADWDFLKNTMLARYLNVSNNTATQSNPMNQQARVGALIPTRSIPMCILLSVVTCGIYGLYWLYQMAEDTNKILASQGRASQASGGMVILLSIVTCNIYLLFWLYKSGKSLSEIQFSNGYRTSDDSLIMTLLAVFGLPIISYCILQSTLNDISTNASL